MPLLFDGKPTTIQAGDVLVMDVDDATIHIERNGEPLAQVQEGQDVREEGWYFTQVAEGLHIEPLVQLVADAAGLKFEELRDGGNEYRFRFI